MAVYKVALRQAVGEPFFKKWSNTYYIDAGSGSEALDLGLEIWEDYLREVFSEGIYCYEIYANSTFDPPGSPGVTLPVPVGTQRGQLTGWSPATALPLFNTVRVDIFVIASRPSRKFLRPGLTESSIENGQLFPAYGPLIKAQFDLLAALPYTVDVDGQKWTSSIVKGITSRRLGREAGVDVPPGPPFG